MRIVRCLAWVGLFLPLLFFAVGILFWVSEARLSGSFQSDAWRERAVASFWVRDRSYRPDQNAVSLSVVAWVRPSRIEVSVPAVNEWIREYLLISGDTDELADDAPYLLPPALIPPFESFVAAEDDPYDVATRRVIENVWRSGLVVVAGEVEVESPLWQKSFLGWYGAGIGLEPLAQFFGLTHSEGRETPDAPFLLAWMSRLPRGELRASVDQGVLVHESVFEISPRELDDLFGRMCGLDAVPEDWCLDAGLPDNPLDPLMKVSREFKTQLKIYWTVRGGTLVWSNQKGCLISAFHSHNSRFSGCADIRNDRLQRAVVPSDALQLRRALLRSEQNAIGYFVNEANLKDAFDKALIEIRRNDVSAEGRGWIVDLLGREGVQALLGAIDSALTVRAERVPYWGATLTDRGPGRLTLLSVAHWQYTDTPLERIERTWAETQFGFLYSLNSVWTGRPKAPARLQHTGMRRTDTRLRHSNADFDVGWSEQE